MEKLYTPKVKAIENTTFWMEFGNHSRVELKNDSFSIGKLHIGLQKFGPDNKQTDYINTYIDLDKALVFANDILNGKFARMAEERAEMTILYKQPGGQSAEKANREDKKPLYREFALSKGKLWILTAQEGPGQTSKTGGFMPDGKPDHRVTVGLSSESLKAMALMIQNEYQAYRVAQFIKLG